MITSNKITKGLNVGNHPYFQQEGTVIKNHNGQFLHYNDGNFVWKSAKGNEVIPVYIEDFNGSLFNTLGLTIMSMTVVGDRIYVLSVAANGNTYIGELQITDSFSIISSTGDNGQIVPVGETLVAEFEDKEFGFTPDTGYELDTVIVDSIGLTGNALALAISTLKYTFLSITEDHTIAITFAARTVWIITPTHGTNGDVDPDVPTNVYEGNDLTIEITISATYQIADVKIDSVSVSSLILDEIIANEEYTFVNVLANHTFHVTFELIEEYLIEISSGVGGGTTPSSDVYVPKNGNQLVTFNPNEGYESYRLYVDGNITPYADDEYEFLNVTESHELLILFQETNPQIFVEIVVEGPGTTTPTEGGLHVDHGSNLQVFFWPENGYSQRELWVKIGSLDWVNLGVSDLDDYWFNNITEPTIIKVIFDQV